MCWCENRGVKNILKKVVKKFARLHFCVVSLQRDSNAAIGPYIEQARNSKGYRRLRRRFKPTDVAGRQQAVVTILASEQRYALKFWFLYWAITPVYLLAYYVVPYPISLYVREKV